DDDDFDIRSASHRRRKTLLDSGSDGGDSGVERVREESSAGEPAEKMRDTNVGVPPIDKRSFSSWDAFKDYLMGYCERTKQHALIKDESSSTLQTVCKQFKDANAAWSNIRCIVMYKDFTEMSVIEAEFPEARILLCQWNVERYLQDEIVKSKYAFSDWQRNNLRSIMRDLIDAPLEEVFDKHNYGGDAEDDFETPAWRISKTVVPAGRPR
ncbi:hypothetical protein PybrP1_011368, partial [[Pythium] brassicae (nom. inval.)]